MFENRFLRFKEYLVIGDLHLGFEHELGEKGYNVPSQTGKMLESIKKMAKKTKSTKLIILGDLKHAVPNMSSQEKREIPFFVRKLDEFFEEVVLIKGNHDGRIEDLVKIDVKKEFVLDNVGFIHGHALPSKEFMEKTKCIVMAHIHPSYKWRDHLGHRHSKSCWIIGRWKEKKVIIVPVFNESFYGSSELIGPFSKELKREEIILTDMTKLL